MGIVLFIRLPRVSVPSLPELQGVFEAQGSWQYIGQQGGLRHHKADQVVGQQINPHFFLAHLWSFAAQRSHAQRGFEVANVQFHLPAPLVQFLQCIFGRDIRTEQRRDQYAATYFQFTNNKRIRRSLILFRRHPLRAYFWFLQGNQMIPAPQLFAAPKVSRAAA